MSSRAMKPTKHIAVTRAGGSATGRPSDSLRTAARGRCCASAYGSAIARATDCGNAQHKISDALAKRRLLDAELFGRTTETVAATSA